MTRTVRGKLFGVFSLGIPLWFLSLGSNRKQMVLKLRYSEEILCKAMGPGSQNRKQPPVSGSRGDMTSRPEGKRTGSGNSKETSEGKFGRSYDRAKRIDTLIICLTLTRTLLSKTHSEAPRQRSSLLWSIHQLHRKDGGERYPAHVTSLYQNTYHTI